MRRTERLFQIIQILRSRRVPVTGHALAHELEISLRTLYRDMAELIAQRVPVRGEAGTGYVLEDGYDMPPLMLTADELEAAALGAAWVAARGDVSLARGARDLVAKLSAAVPAELRPLILDAGLRPMQWTRYAPDPCDGAVLRQAIRGRHRLSIDYKDKDAAATQRVIWPLFIAFLDTVRIVVGWCETRQDFRHFRTDRIQSLADLGEVYPARRDVLMKRWQAQNLRQCAQA